MADETILAELERRLEPISRRSEIRLPSGATIVHLKQLKHIRCADGFTMSVQASESHYCTPRDSNGHWFEVEVGFPSERDDALMPYVEDAEKPTQTVYGYVPINVVADVIERHGGFAESA